MVVEFKDEKAIAVVYKEWLFKGPDVSNMIILTFLKIL